MCLFISPFYVIQYNPLEYLKTKGNLFVSLEVALAGSQ